MRTLICYVLDESGSMDTCRASAISAFNEFLSTQKTVTTDDGFMTLTKFNTVTSTPYVAKPLADVPPLTFGTYLPSGMTALYDAIVRTIKAVEPTVLERETRVVVVIQTDGEENSSREFNLHHVRNLIDQKTATGYWTFVFLGANMDAWATAQTLGVPQGNVAAYAGTPTGTHNVMRHVADSVKSYRGGGSTYSTSMMADTPEPGEEETDIFQTTTPSVTTPKGGTQ